MNDIAKLILWTVFWCGFAGFIGFSIGRDSVAGPNFRIQMRKLDQPQIFIVGVAKEGSAMRATMKRYGAKWFWNGSSELSIISCIDEETAEHVGHSFWESWEKNKERFAK